MTLDEGWGYAIKALVAILTAAVVGLFRWVVGTRGRVKVLEKQVEVLEKQIAAQLTKEDMREVINDILAKRDTIAVERRQEWERRLPMQIKLAVQEGVKEHLRDAG